MFSSISILFRGNSAVAGKELESDLNFNVNSGSKKNLLTL